MKICHVITRMIIGGAQENTLFSCIGQLEAGHQVTLLTGIETGDEGNLLNGQTIKGLKVVKIPYLKRSISLFDDYKAYSFLRKYFRKNNFDVVHTHSSKAGILGRIAAYKEGIRCVVHTIHGLAFHQYEKWYKNKLYILAERFAAKYCHKIFSVANAMTQQALEQKIGNISMYETIRSGMEINSYKIESNNKLREKLGIGEDQIVIGKVARLFELKGHDELIRIASELSLDNTIFLIVGDGPLRSYLEAEIKQRGLTKSFIFMGLVKPSEIPDYIACMDILIHLSVREGLARAVVQALAGSCPAVAYNLDGTPEVIKHNKTGLLYEPSDRKNLLEGLQRLIADSSWREELGNNGHQLIQENFTIEKMVADLQKQYEIILSTNS